MSHFRSWTESPRSASTCCKSCTECVTRSSQTRICLTSMLRSGLNNQSRSFKKKPLQPRFHVNWPLGKPDFKNLASLRNANA